MRYFTLRDQAVHPRQECEIFAWRVEPIATMIRQNCQQLWEPCSHLAIDEAMIPFRGRTHHKAKLPNKPIKEGYKIWAVGDAGYILDWLWHSRLDGPESIPANGLTVDRVTGTFKDGEKTQVHLAPTFALIIRLAQRLRQLHPVRIFCLFLDNLFLNLDVAQCLLALRICCTGTTLKNAQGVPQWLIELKKHNQSLVWNSALAEVVESTLCFLWQDNNAVLGLTTAYRLKNETIERLRKRPAPTSTNAKIVRPVFGDLPVKRLQIPLVIDEYNHYMNGVDRANHLRHNLTAHRPFEKRVWRPIWYWLLDICAVNGYKLFLGDKTDHKKRGQRQFRMTIIDALLNTPYESPSKHAGGRPPKAVSTAQENCQDRWKSFAKRGYCVQCKSQTGERPRPALAEVVNGVAPARRQRSTRTLGGCEGCGVYLCQKGGCFKAFHSSRI